MTRRDPIEAYVAELRIELGRRRLHRRLLDEVEAHLCEAVAVRVGGGASPDEAASEAVRSFGAPQEVAAALALEVPEVRRFARVLVSAAGAAAAAAVVVTLALMSADPAERMEPESSASRPLGRETARVAEALDLSPDASRVLAKAQMHGQRASNCLVVHGARPTPGGGLADPSGEAYRACQPLLDANERNLSDSDFLEVLSEAQPRFVAAERCDAARNPARDRATASRSQPVSEGGGASDGATCFTRDGLPAAATT